MAKRRESKAHGPWKHALVGAFLFSVVAMSQVLPHFATYKFGPNISGVGSDSYGVLYSYWISAQKSDAVVREGDKDLLSGFPNGRPVVSHIQAGSALAQQLARAGVSPVACYNLMIWLWFFGAYCASFFIFNALGVARPLSHLGAFVIGLHPYQTLQSVDHADLAMTWPLLLNIYLLVQLMVHRRPWAAPWLIVLTGAAVFTHPYYLICAALLNVLPLGWFVYQVARGRTRPGSSIYLGATAAAAAAAGLILFWKSLFTSDGGGIEAVDRSIEHLYIYSTKIWDFLLPPHYSMLFERFTTEFKTNQTVAIGSNFVENTLYPGFLILLALPFAIHRLVARRNPALVLCLLLLTVPIVLSISPSFDVFGFKIYSPTYFLHGVLPQFRTMSRFAYVAAIGMVILFILAANHFLADRSGTKAARAAIVALFVLFAADLGYFHKRFYSDAGKVPEVYTYLRDSTPRDAVIFEVPFMWGALTQYWQSHHQRRNFGHFDPVDRNFQQMAMTSRLDLNGLIQFARAFRITHLVLHTSQDVQLPGVRFTNQPDDTWIFFGFARHSYVIDVARTGGG